MHTLAVAAVRTDSGHRRVGAGHPAGARTRARAGPGRWRRPGIDAVAVPAGHSIYTRAAGVTGEGLSTGPRYLVTGSGVAFGVGDAEAAEALGLPPAPGAAPWPLLALLPRGPELGVARATVVRDSVGAPS